MEEQAYPALFVVPKTKKRDDGVHYTPEPPTVDKVVSIVNEALEDSGWTEGTNFIDARAGTRELQDEVPPADPVDVDGVTVVFDQTPAPEAEGYGWSGPFATAKMALGEQLHVEVWIDAVVR